MSGALRVGSDGIVHLLVVDGYKPKNLDGYTVTATAKFQDSTTAEFSVTISEDDFTVGQLTANFNGANLTEEGTLALELFYAGTPTINPNSEPILIPVRASYAVAP